MRKSAFKAGKTIIKEGDVGTEAYIIVDGEVEVSKKTRDGSTIILSRLGTNQMFGEICLIDDTLRRSATVKAVTDVVVAVITKESLIDKIQSTPVSIKSILKVMAKRLADTNEMFIDLHSRIDLMVREQVGQVIQANKIMKQELDDKENEIEELKAEVEKLKVSGPVKAQKAASQTQKLDKDRSMKLSLKDLDNIVMQQKQKEKEKEDKKE